MAVKNLKKTSKADKKAAYDEKLCNHLDTYSKILVVGFDNVSSNQLQIIRRALRVNAVVLMGKNTMMKRSIHVHASRTGNTALLSLIPLIVGKVGLIFTNGDVKEVRDEVTKYKIGASARCGTIAPVDVVVPPGNTGLDPSHTQFFQVLNIPTKIIKGTVEIITTLELVKKGERVGSSEADILSRLKLKPFSYGLIVKSVYDNGFVFQPEVLDLTEDDLVSRFAEGLTYVISLSMALGYPTLAAVPHMVINAYKNVLSVGLVTDYSFPLAEQVKENLQDPSKFAVAAAPPAPSAPAATIAASAPATTIAANPNKEKKEEISVDSDDDYVIVSLF